MRTMLVAALAAVCACPLAAQTDSALLRHALRLHRAVPMIDGHNDFVWEVRGQWKLRMDSGDMAGPLPTFQTDIPRLRAGGVGGQFWSIFVADSQVQRGPMRIAMEQIDIVKRMEARYPNVFLPARTADDIMRAHRTGRIASLIGIEGGHAIENSLGALRMFYTLGARYMTLTWNNDLLWADAHSGAHQHNGLTPFGYEVVREMNRLGMLVDISHVSDSVMAQVLRTSEAPVIFSHSSARALAPTVTRDVPDEILRMVPRNGGVVMVNFYCDFVDSARVRWLGERRAMAQQLRGRLGSDTAAIRAALVQWAQDHTQPRTTIATIADHIDHVRDVAGIDHIGYGSDFDGIDCAPEGLSDVSMFPRLTAELIRRGYSDADVEKVLGLNLIRALRGAEAAARRIQATRPPSVATVAMDSVGARQ